jgi:hypothetical protein
MAKPSNLSISHLKKHQKKKKKNLIGFVSTLALHFFEAVAFSF